MHDVPRARSVVRALDGDLVLVVVVLVVGEVATEQLLLGDHLGDRLGVAHVGGFHLLVVAEPAGRRDHAESAIVE